LSNVKTFGYINRRKNFAYPTHFMAILRTCICIMEYRCPFM